MLQFTMHIENLGRRSTHCEFKSKANNSEDMYAFESAILKWMKFRNALEMFNN